MSADPVSNREGVFRLDAQEVENWKSQIVTHNLQIVGCGWQRKGVMILTQEQEKVVGLSAGRHLVLAPPGSGKTEMLSQRILRALEAGVPPERMLCATFTNRAAFEMRERMAADVFDAARQVGGGCLDRRRPAEYPPPRAVCAALEAAVCRHDQDPVGKALLQPRRLLCLGQLAEGVVRCPGNSTPALLFLGGLLPRRPSLDRLYHTCPP